jgi:DNA-binding transcriptional LysR family regulator
VRRLDTEFLATFVAVVDAAGFTAASHRVGKTQAAVSAQISRFEAQLGKKLLDRSRRGIHLTEAGEILVGYARRILAVEDEALAAIQGNELAGRVRVGMPDDYVGLFGPPLIETFSARNPRIQVEITCNFSVELETQLERGELDVAIITRGSVPCGDLLRQEALVWCAARDKSPERQELLPLALFPERFCRARPLILQALNRAGRPWRVAWTSSHLSSIQTAIDLGGAVTALPASIISPNHRRLGPVDGLPEIQSVELALLVRQGAPVAVRLIASFIRSLEGAGPQAADESRSLGAAARNASII